MEVAGAYNGAYEGDNQGQCEMSFAVGDSVVDREYMTTNSICQTLNTYKWGFSSLPLFFFCILTALYVLALAMLQWEVYRYSRIGRVAGSPSIYRDILTLADEIRTRFVPPVQEFTAAELETMVRTDMKPLRADLGSLPLSRSEEAKMRVFASVEATGKQRSKPNKNAYAVCPRNE